MHHAPLPPLEQCIVKVERLPANHPALIRSDQEDEVAQSEVSEAVENPVVSDPLDESDLVVDLDAEPERVPPTPANRNCGKPQCKSKVRGENPLKCFKCKTMFHIQTKCSKLSREAVKLILSTNAHWICYLCEEKEQRNYTSPYTAVTEVSEKVKGTENKSLRVLQWNADGINTKIHELKSRLLSENIDVCNIQESKLRPHMPTPKLPGYKAAKRVDRKGGGDVGLITSVKDTLVFEGGGDS